MRRFALVAAAVVLILAMGAGAAWWALRSLPSARSDYVPRDPLLRRARLFFYVPRAGQPRARAFVFFLGNDVGFWRAHQELAADLAAHGYAVVGYDVKPLVDSLPPGTSASAAGARAAIFAGRIDTLVRASRRELGMEDAPVVLMGHSFGAELALWIAHQLPIPQLRGVVAISPAARGHLMITLQDLADVGHPQEPGSFSVATLAGSLPETMRIALVRGDHDRLRGADSAIVTAGGPRLRYFGIPMAGHSLKRIIVARYVVRDAIGWVADAPAR